MTHTSRLPTGTPETPPSDGTTDDGLPPAIRRTLTALVIGGAAAILDTTVVTIALHRLTIALGSSTATIQWVVTAYLLAVAIAVPLSGWSQARFGAKTSWIAALTVFVVFSAACAASWNAGSLIAFRACQGFGAGLIFPLLQTLAMQSAAGMSEKARSKAVVAVTVPIALGPILGPVLGGVVLNWLNWRWMFLINVPLVLVGIALAWRLLEPDQLRSGKNDANDTRLDVVGLCLLAPGLAGVLLGLSRVGAHGRLDHLDVLLPLTVGSALLAVFAVHAARRAGRALVDVSVLRLRSVATSSATMFAAGASLYAGMVLLPLYWQQVRGSTVLVAAMLLIPQGVGALTSRMFAPGLIGRLGARTVTVAAFLVTALGTAPFATATAGTNPWWLGAVLFVRGIGLGTVLIGPMMTAYRDVAVPRMPHATMTTRISQQVGASVGAGIVAVILQTLVTNGVTQGFHGTFWCATGITVVAVLPALAMRAEPASGA